MLASEIRSRFLAYFEKNGHAVRPSSTLVPADDPTLLFVNAGMVQFKKVFLGMEEAPNGKTRVATAQKCVRAGGKHNDLEQVGHTARHQTFFEMLGNFSFGDYFKRDAIRFAWEFITEELKLPKEHLRVTVFHSDDEARALWKEITGLPDSRIYGLQAKDNFWQMADTGPCGPCSEIFIDQAHMAADWKFPEAASGEWTITEPHEFSLDAFEKGAEESRFLEFWNLVFMQFDRQENGELVPLPKPSVDTGAGLERISAIKQGVTNSFHTDLFLRLIAEIESLVGFKYRGREDSALHTEWVGGNESRSPTSGSATRQSGQHETRKIDVDPASFRVIADHARSVAFLLADGVFPSNEGRGYVLRRILRRGVRHAWLLGRRQPTLARVVEVVIAEMGTQYPELQSRSKHIIDTTRAEEERFLATIDAGMTRFELLAPVDTVHGSPTARGTLSGEDAFLLYDTFGFPIDLTELMARERGYLVDIAGFEQALTAQRTQSREERKSRQHTVVNDDFADPAAWRRAPDFSADEKYGTFVGYSHLEVHTDVIAMRKLPDGREAVILRESPFYAESGGQISDKGMITAEFWNMLVDEVRKIEGRIAAIGTVKGDISFGRVIASVPTGRRHDTERHHTATHLLHSALREILGDHVHQAGSLVTPDRLRFDFTHHGPVTSEQLAQIERKVNAGIWQAVPVTTSERSYNEAVASGAMALFGEKYGDVVRVVDIPSLSTELCGGTHVRNTAEIGLLRIVNESGVAAGVRRVEAVAGPHAFALMTERDRALVHVAGKLKVNLGGATAGLEQLERKVDSLLEENKSLERRLDEAMRGGTTGGGVASQIVSKASDVAGVKLAVSRVDVPDVKSFQALADGVRDSLGTGVGVLGAALADGKGALIVVVTDDLRERGYKADTLVRDIAATVGGRGGGKPHMAQAGVDAAQLDAALQAATGIVSRVTL